MPYIKLEDLQKFPIRKDHYDKEHGNEHFIYGVESVLEYAEYLPTYDVAPKSEVATEILREVRQALLHMILANSMGETYDIEKRFAEIEKKYTEDQS